MKDKLLTLSRILFYAFLIIILLGLMWLFQPLQQGDCGIPAGGCTTPDGVYHADTCFNYDECNSDICEWHWSWYQELRC